MKMIAAVAVFATALFGLGAAAMADDGMMSKSAMSPAMAHVATMECRAAASGETANAMTSAKAPLVCKAVDMKTMMSMKKMVESMPNGQDTWSKWFAAFQVPYN